jgi:SAM-dependent methyltransferase
MNNGHKASGPIALASAFSGAPQLRLETQALLRCVAPQPGHVTGRHQSTTNERTRCGGALVLAADESGIVCTRCQETYPLVAQAPCILPPDGGQDHYRDDEIIHTYYEAHYGPFITQTPELRARLTFPLAELVQRAEEGVSVEAFTDVHWQGSTTDRSHALYRQVAPLMVHQDLTEAFYQCMLDLCRPYVGHQTRVLDMGCGLGRMAAELARLGAKLVVGLDRSPRMVKEASRILHASGPVPLELNLVGKQSVRASLVLPWTPPENLDFIVGDVLCLPMRTEAVDLITCVNLLDRVPQPGQMVHELGRVLRPGGYLLIADPYHWEEQYTAREEWVADMASLFAPGIWRRIREVDGVPFVLRYFSRRVTVYMNHCVVFQKIEP